MRLALPEAKCAAGREAPRVFAPRSDASLIRKRSLIRIQVRPPVICRGFFRLALRRRPAATILQPKSLRLDGDVYGWPGPDGQLPAAGAVFDLSNKLGQ